MPETSLNTLIDGTGMCFGNPSWWSKCSNPDCQDPKHGDGCMVNIDIDTLDRMLPPSRNEYAQLRLGRLNDRPDVSYTTRFSCQIPLTEELDGALIALKQLASPGLRGRTAGWSTQDDYATVAVHRSQRIEPWAPLIEEPTLGIPYSFDMLWAGSYQEILKMKDPGYRRTDGCATYPRADMHDV